MPSKFLIKGNKNRKMSLQSDGSSLQASPIFGMGMAIGAFFMLSVMSLFAKLLSDRHHIAEIAFWRNIIAFIPFLILAMLPGRRGVLKIRSQPGMMVVRAIVGTVNILLVFGAFSLLPMANATSLVFASALFTPILGIIFLSEGVGIYRASAIVIGFIGVLIVAQPEGQQSWNIWGVAFGLGAACIAASLNVILRFLGKSETPETMTFYFLFFGILLLLPVMPFIATMPTLDETWLILGLGLSGALMQIMLSNALKYAPAALVAPMSYTQIVWATFFGWIIFSTVPGMNIIFGASIIIGSSLIVILRERYLARKGDLGRGADMKAS